MKQMKYFFAVALALSLFGCGTKEKAADEGASLILTNARVYTLDWAQAAPDGSLQPGAPHDGSGWHPDADAVVINGDEIAYV
ncbi:MAG: hypothetical protein WBN23_15115, partial [Woeseia sp.]